MDLNLINKLLIELDFEKVDYVYEPGQFAIRGGIVDVFSYHSEYPYRLELFGDEVESIREFNPVMAESSPLEPLTKDQLSNITLDKIKIVPNINNPKLEKSKNIGSKSSINKKNQYENFQFNTTKSDGFTWYKLFLFVIKILIAISILFILFYSFGQIFPNMF